MYKGNLNLLDHVTQLVFMVGSLDTDHKQAAACALSQFRSFQSFHSSTYYRITIRTTFELTSAVSCIKVISTYLITSRNSYLCATFELTSAVYMLHKGISTYLITQPHLWLVTSILFVAIRR